MTSKRATSRPARWAEAAAKVVEGLSELVEGLSELVELQSEYAEWLGNLPENLQASTLGKKLQAIADLALEDAAATVEEAEAIDLPRGFGRD